MAAKITAAEQRRVVANNLTNLANESGETVSDIARALGLADATVRSWFYGTKYPRIDKVQLLADHFHVPRSSIIESQAENARRITRVTKIPVLGEIACGDPITAEENIDDYREEISESLPTGSLFFLLAKGNSMSPTIPDGSYVLIKEQPEVEDGEIAAVLVNDDTEATLKRVKHQGNIVLLLPDNPDFEPIIITESNPARVLGKAIKVSFDL